MRASAVDGDPWPSLDTLDAHARAYAERALASRTLREYAKVWTHFGAWCTAHDLSPLPCSAQTLIRYVSDRAARGVRPASLQVALAAIAHRHRDAGAIAPLGHPDFRRVWGGIRRTHGVAQRQVAPAVADELRAMLDTLPGTTRGLRDRAMLTLGFVGAFRRSELVNLNRDDVAFKPHGLHVVVRRAKDDQEAASATVGLPAGASPQTDPVRTLRAWLAVASRKGGDPLFCSVDRYGHVRGGRLYGHDVASLVKRAAAAAGLDPAIYSSHSLRAGLATSAANAGKSDRAIMAQGRWTSRSMVDRYVRNATLLSDANAAAGLGL